MNNVELSKNVEREIKRLINRAQKEVLEVCAKEYNFDINAAMLLVGAGGLRKGAKEAKSPKEKKERAKKAVKELIEGEVEGDRKRNCLEVEGDRKRNCSRGRPKNPEKVVEVEETENLFETLVNTHMQKEENKSHIEVEFQTKDEKKTEEGAEKVERLLMLVEEKDTRLVNKMEAKEQAKLAKDQAKEQDKLAKEQDKLAKEQEKLAAKEAEKLAKEQAKEAEKLAKEQAKLAKEQAKSIAGEKKLKVSATETSTKEKKTKVNTKKTVEATTSSKVDVIAKESTDVEYQTKMIDLSEKLEAAPGHKLVMPVVAVVAVVAEAPATLKVKSFKYEGKTYFREKTTGAIYDKETNDHLGQWNETTQKIDYLEAEEELEEEDESAGESSDEEEEEEEDA